MSIFFYPRVSHKNSEISDLSIPEQIESAMRYASHHIPGVEIHQSRFDSDIPGVYADKAVSGWSKSFNRRPAGYALLQAIKKGDHLVCYSIDRFGRNVRDFCNTTFELDRMGVHVHFVEDQINVSTAVGKLQLHMRAAAAQFASDIISERTREALAIRNAIDPNRPAKPKRLQVLPSGFDMSTPAVTNKIIGGRVFRYERVSTPQQYLSGLGLAHQAQANSAYAQQLIQEIGAKDMGVCKDNAVSAFSTPLGKRKNGRLLCERLRAGDHVVVYRIDRAWRSLPDCMNTIQKWSDQGVYVHFVNEGIRTDTKKGEEWIGVFAAIAQMESSKKSTHTRAAMQRCRELGRPVNQETPIGFQMVQVGINKAMFKFDMQSAADRCMVYVMREEMDFTATEVDAVLTALRCQKKGKKASLADVTRYFYRQHSAQCIRIKKAIGPKLWEQVLEKSRYQLSLPIPRHFWYRPKWEGESISVVEWRRRLNQGASETPQLLSR